MYVECINNNGIPYLRLVKSVRVTNKDGVRTCRKKSVCSIGPLSRFDDGKPDYVKRLKESFKAGTPLIPALEPYCSEEKSAETYTVSITEDTDFCFGEVKTASSVILGKLMEELGLSRLFLSDKSYKNLKYDINGFAKLLIFGRFLKPGSDYDVTDQNSMYYEPIFKNYDPGNVYDALDFICENKDKIVRKINTALVQNTEHNMENICYNVFSLNYETEEPEQKLSSVCTGLFTDSDGMPIDIVPVPGNSSDRLSLVSALRNSIDNIGHSHFILIEKRDIYDYSDLLQIKDEGNGYIVCRNLPDCAEEAEWAYSSEDFRSAGKDFRYKSRIIKKTAADKTGKPREIEEQIIVYKSRNLHGSKSKSRYRQIATSETKMKAPDVIRKYIEFTQIEDQFRSMQNNPGTEPIYVRTKEHMEAHLVICFIALVMLRIIQQKIITSENLKTGPDTYRNTALNGQRIREALLSWGLMILPDDLYEFMNMQSPDLQLILKAFNTDIPKKLYRRGELKHIKQKIKIF